MKFPSHWSLRILFFVVLGCLAAVVPSMGQEFTTIERGIKPERSFEVGDIDQVRLFNGALTMAIPIGQEYPLGLGSELSYRLTLTYSNQVWDYITREEIIPGQGSGDPPDLVLYNQAHPGRIFNAGLGWRLSLGEYWNSSVSGAGRCGECYIGPDGGQHPFYQTLHPGIADDSTNTLYTRDGTYLRLRKNVREIDFPNGQIHRFDTQGRLTQIRDRLGNVVNVTYAANSWTINDGLRAHTVNLVNVAHYGKAVGSVVLRTFGGGTASYAFQYAQPQVARACLDSDPDTSSFLQIPLLTKVTLPDGSSYEMPVTSYDIAQSPPCENSDYVPVEEGLIKEVKLPTRGKISWTYQAFNFPGVVNPEEPELPEHLKRSTGVKTRTLRTASGATIGTWTYTPSLTAPAGGQDAIESVTEVLSPLKDRTNHYFRVGDREDSLYGLPVSSLETAPGRPDLQRSVKAYDCDSNGNNCVLRRTIYRKYVTDSPFAGGPESNPRVEAEYTRFHDDANRWISRDFSSFDGLGHYRIETVTSNIPGGANRTTRRNFNPTRGTFPGSFVMPTTATPWVLETLDYQQQQEGSKTFRTDFCFDTATGFLKRARVRKSSTGAIGTTDLVSVFTRNAGAQQILEQRYGGDLAPVGTGALCTLSLGADSHRIRRSFQHGSLRFLDFLDTSNNVVLRSVDRTIDLNTGLTAVERDTALVPTTYVYDTMSRVTQIKPANDAWVQYTYQAPITGKPKLQLVTHPNGTLSNSNYLTWNEFLFDDLGRLIRERRRIPGGSWSRRTTQYDGLSNVKNLSEWQADAPNNIWTRFRGYDAFNRPAFIDPPEGSGHRITFTYTGNRVITRMSKIGTSLSSGSVATSLVARTQRFDRFGRLYQVVDGTGTTTYTYDPADRLIQASLPGQTRSWTYDGRGFMTAERLPEKGTSGNGTVSYSRFDASGNVGRRSDGPMSVDNLYDRAGRLVRVRIPNGADLKHFTFGNGATNSDRSRGKVKTAKRFNYVTFGSTPFTVEIRETYTYGGRDGRVSRRVTQNFLNGNLGESFTQSFDNYDDLGNLGSLGYPQCTNPLCQAPSPRTVGFGYSFDGLSSVTGWANSITYYNNGMVKSVAHSNGVTDTQTKDPWDRPLPRAIATSGALNPAGTAASNWTTGTYTYDAERNPIHIGSGRYVYDTLSRLKSAWLTTNLNGSAATNRSQTYVYDTVGNRTSTTTNGATVNSPASSSTNRLSGAVSYDGAGNLTAWNGNIYQYDRFGKMWRMKAGAVENIHIYTADDQRIWTFHANENRSSWRVRDLEGKVLREYKVVGANWSVQRDYIYRGDKLLGAWTPSGVHHFHLDHLGTPRLITDSAKRRVAYLAYYPFGQEATSVTQDTERMKFTGHERDLGRTTGSNPAADDLDFMRGRFMNPQLGRFLSVDPARDSDPAVPQSWNLYSYTRNNPLQYVDPSGNVIESAWDAFNIGLGVASLAHNLSEGNYGWAALDAAGIVLDTLATAAPGVPGGASTAIKAGRAADTTGDLARSVGRTTVAKTDEIASPALRNNPYHDDVVRARVKPPYKSNPAHERGPSFNPRKTPEPADAQSVYDNSVRGGLGTWFGRNSDGAWYQFFSDNAGGVHFAGEIKPDKVPIEIRRQFAGGK